MKVIKKINNNVAICKDKNGAELVAFGNGIGFPKTPYELEDLSKITRTYYGVKSSYLDLLQEIPKDIFEISAKIVDYAQTKIFNELNPNIVFTLADHIHFAIERYEKKITVKMPFGYDIEHFYAKEMEIGKKAVVFINKVKHIHLSGNEAVGIALHFINSENNPVEKQAVDDKKVINEITKLIEKKLGYQINRRGFSYSRFVTHMQYLLLRQDSQIEVDTENKRMFESVKEEYQSCYMCVLEIQKYIENKLGWIPNDEELLYLMMHVNRLMSREDCNQ